MERLYRKLEEYSRADYYPFHMPGHKRNSASVRGEFPLERECGETVWDQRELLQC